MSYQNPIELIQTSLRLQTEGAIIKAVQNVGVNVNKDELIKALQYDRDQYQKGYADRDAEIVRCKYCKYGNHEAWAAIHSNKDYWCCVSEAFHCGDWFCADGKKREAE